MVSIYLNFDKFATIKSNKMKKTLLVIGIACMAFVSCGESKKEPAKKEVEKEVVKEEKVVDIVAKGKKLFQDKTCTSCHQMDQKVIGPSLIDINSVYTEQNGDYMKFLKGEAAAIVSTNEGEIAIMKANLDSFVKNLTDDELTAIIAYMKSVK